MCARGDIGFFCDKPLTIGLNLLDDTDEVSIVGTWYSALVLHKNPSRVYVAALLPSKHKAPVGVEDPTGAAPKVITMKGWDFARQVETDHRRK